MAIAKTQDGSESANDTSRLDGNSSRPSKNRTIAGAIKGMFKAAAKLFAARDDDAQAAARKRKSGEKESGAPIRPRKALTFPARIAAHGRYTGLRSIRKSAVRLLRRFTEAADDAALPEFADTQEFPSNTLEWLNQWSQENVAITHGLDDHSDTQQNQNPPHP